MYTTADAVVELVYITTDAMVELVYTTTDAMIELVYTTADAMIELAYIATYVRIELVLRCDIYFRRTCCALKGDYQRRVSEYHVSDIIYSNGPCFRHNLF